MPLWLKKKPTAHGKQHSFVAGRFWGSWQQCFQAVSHIDIFMVSASTLCACIVTGLNVSPSACPRFQRWRSVLYTLCHGSVLSMSSFESLLLPGNVADEFLICDIDLLSRHAIAGTRLRLRAQLLGSVPKALSSIESSPGQDVACVLYLQLSLKGSRMSRSCAGVKLVQPWHGPFPSLDS